MSYKVGATVVIDNLGKIPWARIIPGKLSAGDQHIAGTPIYRYTGAGNVAGAFSTTGLIYDNPTTFRLIKTANLTNCAGTGTNCNCNCYC